MKRWNMVMKRWIVHLAIWAVILDWSKIISTDYSFVSACQISLGRNSTRRQAVVFRRKIAETAMFPRQCNWKLHQCLYVGKLSLKHTNRKWAWAVPLFPMESWQLDVWYIDIDSKSTQKPTHQLQRSHTSHCIRRPMCLLKGCFFILSVDDTTPLII